MRSEKRKDPRTHGEEEIASRSIAAACDSRLAQVPGLAPLITIAPEGLSAVGEGEGEEFELAVDSGASETVINDGYGPVG